MDAVAAGLGIVGLCLALWILHAISELEKAQRAEVARLYDALERSIR